MYQLLGLLGIELLDLGETSLRWNQLPAGSAGLLIIVEFTDLRSSIMTLLLDSAISWKLEAFGDVFIHDVARRPCYFSTENPLYALSCFFDLLRTFDQIMGMGRRDLASIGLSVSVQTVSGE